MSATSTVSNESATSAMGGDSGYQGMLTQLRDDLLSTLLAPTAICALYASLLISWTSKEAPFAHIWAGLAALAICLGAHRLVRTHPRRAALLYTAGLTALTMLLVLVHYLPIALILFPILIIVSASLNGVRTSLAIALCSTAVVLIAHDQRGLASIELVAPLASIWLTFTVAWLTLRTLQTATQWAWTSYQQAAETTEIVRQHRAELSKTNKVLSEAYGRLEKFSVQLAHAREEAETVRRAKQQFVANVSHELRTPLNIIVGFSETIILSPESYGVVGVPRQFMGDLNRIFRGALHLKSLIDDVLELAKIDADQMPLLVERSTIGGVVDEVADLVSGMMQHKGLALHLAVPDDLPALYFDRLRIRQVLLNLMSNAVRFTASGGITITVHEEGDHLLVCVADTGPGIAPDKIDKVFEEFHQLDAASTQAYGGTGLGLALSRRFVTLHGGRMWVESVVGQGSKFYFTLPTSRVTHSLGSAPTHILTVSPQEEARTERTVLVVTNEPLTANLLKRHLHSFDVRIASERDAAGAVEQYLPAAIIADSVIGQSSGSGRPGHSIPDGIPIIHCPIPGLHHLCTELAVDHYLVKPVGREQLLTAISQFAARSIRQILIVEDDAQLAQLFVRIIDSAPTPYEATVASTATEALDWAQVQIPDLILLDLMLGQVDGLDLLRQFRADHRLASVPIIIVSARELVAPDLSMPIFGDLIFRMPPRYTISNMLRTVQSILETLPAPDPIAAGKPMPRPPSSHSPLPVS